MTDEVVTVLRAEIARPAIPDLPWVYGGRNERGGFVWYAPAGTPIDLMLFSETKRIQLKRSTLDALQRGRWEVAPCL